jgi:hypothetical protein
VSDRQRLVPADSRKMASCVASRRSCEDCATQTRLQRCAQITPIWSEKCSSATGQVAGGRCNRCEFQRERTDRGVGTAASWLAKLCGALDGCGATPF